MSLLAATVFHAAAATRPGDVNGPELDVVASPDDKIQKAPAVPGNDAFPPILKVEGNGLTSKGSLTKTAPFPSASSIFNRVKKPKSTPASVKIAPKEKTE